MKKISLFAAFLLLSPFIAFAGSQTFSTPGNHVFIVPDNTGDITVEVWGGGQEAQAYGPFLGETHGASGGTSSFNNMVFAAGGYANGSQPTGGAAWGGDANITGNPSIQAEPGYLGIGGSAPVGGRGGFAPNQSANPSGNGEQPGGGGGNIGCAKFICWDRGGGSGGYAIKTYAAGILAAGASIPVKVGAGGSGGHDGDRGGDGMVKITWVELSAPSRTRPAPVCGAVKDPTKKTTGASGSQTFSSVGEYYFTVPEYNTLTVEVWGGGQFPVAYAPFMGETHGAWGGTSIFNNTVYAEGGHMTSNDPVTPGNAWGGDTNIQGNPPIQAEPGYVGIGGNAPFGGIGGFYPDPNSNSNATGQQPGGGGGNIGCAKFICWDRGGASGGYAKKTYHAGDFDVGDSIWLYVGAGGSESGYRLGGDGMIKITWTATGQTLSLCSAGYALKNGKCVSTAVCATCPAGHTLKTIPGSRIPATSGGGGTPGSQTYSTPGTHTFTVPANYQSLTVTVNGAGGGGSGAVGNNGQAGGQSSFKNTMVGNGGEGGVWDGGGAPKAASGSASGGNISNITGGGAAGGISARGTTYGVGGSGGQAKSTYASGDLPASVTVVVGAGGAPEPTAVSLGGGGKAGSNGSVIITWTGGSSLSCPTGYTLQGSECVAPDTTQCVPDTTCPAGYHMDLLAQCVIDAPTICIPGHHLDTAANQCVPDNEVVIIGTPRIVGWGTTSVISWSAVGAASCVGTGFDTGRTTSGSYTTDPLLQTTTFTLTCDTGTKTVTIEVPSCPVGYVGTPPACTFVSGTCPVGYTGTPPNCSIASSCPLNYTGTPPNCIPNSCNPSNICNGNNVVNSCTGAVIQSCAYSCANGACVVPSPTVVSWTVVPLIVSQGSATNVSWEVRNVSSCTVSGTNGDSWTGLTGAKFSGAINSQTIFTLNCTALLGSGAPNVTRTATVNIVPVFQEK